MRRLPLRCRCPPILAPRRRRGEYYPAESAEQLQQVFAELPTDVIVSHEVVEVSVAFVALATVLIGLGIFLGERWRPVP
jgi:hypothetical protein